MSDKQTWAKIILYKDGSVHLCTDRYQTYYCTINNLVAFLSNPAVFLESDVQQACEPSTTIVNPNGRPMDVLPGVTLASLDYDRTLTVYFTELFRYIFAEKNPVVKEQQINMSKFINGQSPLDSKTFLLKYFLDYINNLDLGSLYQNKINLHEEAFYSIMREIFNTAYYFEPPAPPEKTTEEIVKEVTNKAAFAPSKTEHLVSTTQYATVHNLTYSSVIGAVHSEQFRTIVKKGHKYFLDPHEKPPASLTKKQNTGNKEGTKQLSRSKKKTSANATKVFHEDKRLTPVEVRKKCLIEKHFSPLIAEYLETEEELSFFVDNGYFEVDWLNHRFLIHDFDLNQRDDKGRTNEQLITSGFSPVSVNPHDPTAPPKPIILHHLGMRGECFATLDDYIESSYFSVFHRAVPTPGLHDRIFTNLKKEFWTTFLAQKKAAGSFDKIPHIYPLKTKKQ